MDLSYICDERSVRAIFSDPESETLWTERCEMPIPSFHEPKIVSVIAPDKDYP